MDRDLPSSSKSSKSPAPTSVHAHVSCFMSVRGAEFVRRLVTSKDHYLHLSQILCYQVDVLKDLNDLEGRPSRLAFDILNFVSSISASHVIRQSVPRYSVVSFLTSYIINQRSHTDVISTVVEDIIQDLRSGRNVKFLCQSSSVYRRVLRSVAVVPSMRGMVCNKSKKFGLLFPRI